MRRSPRELERAIEDLDPDPREDELCPDCGGVLPERDAQLVPAEFVTYPCSCGREDEDAQIDVVVSWGPDTDDPADEDTVVIDFDGLDT